MDKLIKCIVPCHFGTEAVVKEEIYQLGYEPTLVQDGRITFETDLEGIAYANVHLRCGQRVLWEVGHGKVRSFEELFQFVEAIPWEDYIPEDGRFWVTKVSSIKSKLNSAPDIQAITKKAMVSRLQKKYRRSRFEETGVAFPIRIFLLKDEISLCLDTSGEPLHKRGYRKEAGGAPLRETLAAALLALTPYYPDRVLVDPFCGSGTFLIEAAMKAMNIPPGLSRHFTAESWHHLGINQFFKEVKKEGFEGIDKGKQLSLQGFDADRRMIEIAKENAKRAGVEHQIHFQTRAMNQFSHSKEYGIILTNPPYGARLDASISLEEIYDDIGSVMERLDTWSFFILTGYEEALKHFPRKANKNRKIYNGMLQTYFYQFWGKKPPKRK